MAGDCCKRPARKVIGSVTDSGQSKRTFDSKLRSVIFSKGAGKFPRAIIVGDFFVQFQRTRMGCHPTVRVEAHKLNPDIVVTGQIMGQSFRVLVDHDG